MDDFQDIELFFIELKRQYAQLGNTTLINQQLFADIQVLLQTQNASQLALLQKKVQQLSTHLSDYGLFVVMQKQLRFYETQYTSSLLNKSYNYHAIQKYLNSIQDYFKQSAYLNTGLDTSLAQAERYLTALPKEMKIWIQLAKNEHNPWQLEGFDSYYLQEQNQEKKTERLAKYLSKTIGNTTSIPTKWLQQIETGFTRLRLQSLQYQAKGKVFPLKKQTEQLKKALQNFDDAQLLKTIRAFKKIVPKSYLVYPKNNSKLSNKIIDLKGFSAPNSLVNIQLNAAQKWQVTSDRKGQFTLENITLAFGKNVIEFANNDFSFLEEHPTQLVVYLEKNYLFVGRIDPLTQMAFSIEQIDEIVRCAACYNFTYNFSVAENDNRCVTPKCDGKHFLKAADAKFWVEE